MSVSGIPPRGPGAVERPPETEAKPEAAPADATAKPVEGEKAVGDQMDKAPGRPAPPQAGTRGAALPGKGPDLPGSDEAGAAFSLLSAQVGELGDDPRIAARFEIDDSGLLGPGVASTAFSREEITSAQDLMSLLQEGLLELPPELEAAVRERHALMHEPVSQAHVETLLQRLTDGQRTAFADLAKAFGPLFGAMQSAGRAVDRRRLNELRQRGKIRVGRGISLAHIEPAELRELLEDLLGKENRRGEGRAPPHPSDEAEPGEALEEPEEKTQKTLIEPELSAIARDAEIVLPPLDIVALESTIRPNWALLKELGEDELSELLMMQCAAANEGEMGSLIEAGRALSARESELVVALEKTPDDADARAELTRTRAESDALADKLEFYLARRECFSGLVRVMLRA